MCFRILHHYDCDFISNPSAILRSTIQFSYNQCASALKVEANFVPADDGTFWIQYEDFTTNFVSVDICFCRHPEVHPRPWIEARKEVVFNFSNPSLDKALFHSWSHRRLGLLQALHTQPVHVSVGVVRIWHTSPTLRVWTTALPTMAHEHDEGSLSINGGQWSGEFKNQNI
jgi:hypothetical protein